MPRDLDEEKQVSNMTPLATEAEIGSHSAQNLTAQPPGGLDELDDDPLAAADRERLNKMKDLHPYAQILGLGDIDSCVALENAAFVEAHRCPREKFRYRLSKGGELCLGLFTSAGPESINQNAETASTAKAPDSAEPQRKGVLLAHIVATKTCNEHVTDRDMMMPDDWENQSQTHSDIGHQESGRTLALHSLAVLPTYQNRGLGTTILKAYVQRMLEGDVADRIALLAADDLVPYYEKMGFDHHGPSNATFGGGNWNSMVLDFNKIRPKGN